MRKHGIDLEPDGRFYVLMTDIQMLVRSTANCRHVYVHWARCRWHRPPTSITEKFRLFRWNA